MRFLCLFMPNADTPPPTPEHQAEMGRYIAESFKSGVLLATEGFGPSPKDVRVGLLGGKYSITDGPFTEAKELIGGFAILQTKSREEAIEHAKVFLKKVGGGVTEIHELSDLSPIERSQR